VLLRSKFMFQMLADPNCVILNWNVRQVVPELVMDNACTIVCLQETKVQTVDNMQHSRSAVLG
jgi:hypothetical protein